jgi:hypothetical protein
MSTATILKNIVRFTGLVIGVPVALPHLLNVNGEPALPQVNLPSEGGFTVTVDNVNVTVTRLATGPAAVDVYVEHWHTYETVLPPGQLVGLVPFILGTTGGSGPSADPTITFVFRPGGVAGGNVYTTWPTLMAALGTVQGTKIILFDDSIVSPCVVPAGGPYDMTQVIWAGRMTARSAVTVVEGASFTKLRQFTDIVDVTFTGATPPVSDFTFDQETLIFDRGATLTCTGAGPFFSNTFMAGAVTMVLLNGATFNTGATAVLDMAAGAATVIIGGLLGQTADDSVSGAVGSVLINGIIGASARLSATQTAFAGTIIPFNLTIPRMNPTATQTANFGATEADIVRCDPSAGGFNVTLPLAFNRLGMPITVKNVTASANAITILPSGADTIDGAASASIAAGFGSLTFASDGVSEWMIT